MAITLLSHSPQFSLYKPTKPSKFSNKSIAKLSTTKPCISYIDIHKNVTNTAILGAGFGLILVGPAYSVEMSMLSSTLQLSEPSNALSLPTWAIHVSSVVEWVTAMVLVWQYGEKSGYKSWKGLSWGMVPLLGGALCACTWHFFYNSEELELGKNLLEVNVGNENVLMAMNIVGEFLIQFIFSARHEVLVALQAALTVIGNATMCIAALRIYKASEESAKNL